MKNKYISWRRVSTFKQNRRGLGLEAQKEIIRYFVERDGGELIADYSECYTGKDLSGCKELRKAMKHAKETGAILVIAKSDRFCNCQEALEILDEMGEGNIEFCDLPHSDRFTLTLFWAFAEREALIRSILTKQALSAKKARNEAVGGASVKWKETYNNKTQDQLAQEYTARGSARTKRFIESRDTQAFMKVLKNVFPEATQNDLSTWQWKKINTKNGVRQKVLSLMKDYRDIDHNLFTNWDFTDLDSRKLQLKLASTIKNLQISVIKYTLNN
ncbi:Site-specific DNA recombinase [Segatella bryantii]|jgi:DNA invertase Pin-like site-specific DNA recombinase|uniref:recombinase family protein n=1 Tax=Segatella bryantii TaxID=77095 RepID=UPI00089496A6|nr:recombinase family protein [Segatella bryantii]SEA44503.1 Site-specific DNA recombinase [Segatella bryantii]